MTESSLASDQQPTRYPLSFTQDWFITLDQGDDAGSFGPRFLLVCPLRITGHVDLAALQGALDDVVARHELLRTLVIRDADPPHQLVHPPCQVPLEVRDLPSASGQHTGKSRDTIVQELILAAGATTMSTKEVPLLRADLHRFDDRDSALFVTVHHSVADAWSVQVIVRDLAALYAARSTGVAAEMPPAKQYHEYAQWQRVRAADPAEGGALNFWRENLDGAREFGMPNDHEHPDRYSQSYSYHSHTIEADVMNQASALATATRTTLFTVILSAFYVLAYNLTGATDLAIRAFTAGRDEPQFQNTMGLFLNVLPFRTSLDGCGSFRDIVARTKSTFIEAVTHELPVSVIEQAVPDFTKSRENLRTSQFIISSVQAAYGDLPTYPIAEGARVVSAQLSQESEHQDIPTGAVWNMAWDSSGELRGGVLFNRDEFDESTVAGWSAELRRILTNGVRDPDGNWKLRAGSV